MTKIYSSSNYSSFTNDRLGLTAEFGFLGRNLAKGGGFRSASAMGMKGFRAGKRIAKNPRRLLRNKGVVGKVSRYGFKKSQQGMRLGKRLGTSGLNTGKSLLNKIKRTTGGIR